MTPQPVQAANPPRAYTVPGNAGRLNTSRVQPVLWVVAATCLAAYSLYGVSLQLALPALAISTGAAIALAVQIARHPPRSDAARILAYLLAFLANQGVGMFSAVFVLMPGVWITPMPMTAATVGLTLACAALAWWTFRLVRTWTSQGQRPTLESSPRAAARRVVSGLAATGGVLAVLYASSAIRYFLAIYTDTSWGSFPLAPGGTSSWLMTTISVSLAGAVEEPVFVGVAALLWRRPDKRTFLAVAAMAALARSTIHLYYAAGAPEMRKAIALVVIWCAMWSSFNLYVYYRYGRLWPVIVAHGLNNALVATAGPWVITDPVVVSLVSLVLLGVLAVILLGCVVDLVLRGCTKIRTPKGGRQ